LINYQSRLRVWSSQFEAGDFPAICVVSGKPAETWRKFRFFGAPIWSFAFLLLIACGIGFFVAGPLVFLVSRRASGRLPLTKQADRWFSAVIWVSAVLASVGVLMTITGFLGMNVGLHETNPFIGLIGVLLLSLGPIALVAGAVGIQIGIQVGMVNPLGPRGKVLKRQPADPDRIVELFNVHPAFVEAAQRMYAERSPDPAVST
jgi:hypothetical protein